VNAAIADLRQFLVGLRPVLADRTELGTMLVTLADQVRQVHALDIEVDLPSEPLDLAPDGRGELLQIVREALSNVARHADATRARISLARTADGVRLEVADDGHGFDADRPPGAGHFGLSNMADRAAVLGGRLEVSSRRPGGTTIIVTIPMATSAVPAPGTSKEGGT
jgi:signal transduction histidine kinase